ncbi:metal-sensitive transcriptional regulator [Candidatus Bipolaricaulota bacterium]|nr:metal-sensitive transcriptional regulator [Candidatus Bipolaricaulota bacterium]
MPTENKGSIAKEPELKKSIVQRLRTAIGHLSAVERMVEEEQYCIDILKQISAVQASLSKVAHAVADSHMRHCVREAIAEGKGEEEVEEMLETLKYLKHF